MKPKNRTLARDLIDAALTADLTQNELKMFLVLFRQTICYSKKSDPLRLSSLIHYSHIRKDRLLPALQKLLQTGLFTRQPHPENEYEYSIAEEYLAPYADGFFAPALRKNGSDFRPTEAVSEKRTHTTKTNTIFNPTTTSLPYPETWNEQERRSAAHILDGLNPDDARDCLLILSRSMKARAVPSPLGYLHNLVKAARAGRLNRSVLQKQAAPIPTQTTPTPTQTASSSTANAATSTANTSTSEAITESVKRRLRAIGEEIRGLDTLFAFAGEPMDSKTAAKRAQLVAEYQHLRDINTA